MNLPIVRRTIAVRMDEEAPQRDYYAEWEWRNRVTEAACGELTARFRHVGLAASRSLPAAGRWPEDQAVSPRSLLFVPVL